MIKQNIQSIIQKNLTGKAGGILFFSFLVGCLALFHIYLMFLLGTAFGPDIFGAFADSVPQSIPLVSGIIFILILFAAALKLDDRWLTYATYDSKFEGEIKLADSKTIFHVRSGSNGIGLPADMMMFGPASNKLMVKIISVIFLFGPVLLLCTMRGFKEAYKLYNVDKQQAVDIINFIYDNKGRSSFDDILKNLPDISPDYINQLILIDGVILLQKEMQGLALSDSFYDCICCKYNADLSNLDNYNRN
jgi:hypothetical protein